MKKLVLLSFVLLFKSYSQELIDFKTSSTVSLSVKQVFETHVRYASNEDIRAKNNLKQTYFYILGNLSKSTPYAEQLKRWEVIENLAKSYNEKKFKELMDLYLESENEVKEGVAAALWVKSINEKKSSSASLSFIENVKEQLGKNEISSSEIVSSYLILEAVMQSIVNDGVVADFYFMINEPEETTVPDEELGFIDSFEFSPIGYIADYYAADFKYPILNKIINRVVYFDKKEEKPLPLKKDNIELMVQAASSFHPLIENKSNKEVKFSQVDHSGRLIQEHTLFPNQLLSFELNGLSQLIRVKLSDGREYELKSYKKYHFKGKQ